MRRPWLQARLTGDRIIAEVARGHRTSLDLARVFGCTVQQLQAQLHYLARRGRLRRCGVREKDGMGRPCVVWGVKV